MIRCRLWVRWSLEVRLVFWTMVALELLVLGIAANRGKWWVGVAALVISLPAFFWLMRQQMRNLQSMVTVFLDKAAKDWGLQKIGSDDGVRETPK
jgi:hypothetical protein